MWCLSSAGDRFGRLAEREAELRVGLSGRDRFVGLARYVGGDPDQDFLTPPLDRGAHIKPGRDPLEAVEVVEGVEHDVADPGLDGVAQLALRFGVAVQVDSACAKASFGRARQFAA